MAGQTDTFKNSMVESAQALGPTYLEEMLQRSRAIQRHLVP
jgi:hypothetical protein